MVARPVGELVVRVVDLKEGGGGEGAPGLGIRGSPPGAASELPPTGQGGGLGSPPAAFRQGAAAGEENEPYQQDGEDETRG